MPAGIFQGKKIQRILISKFRKKVLDHLKRIAKYDSYIPARKIIELLMDAVCLTSMLSFQKASL